jgi:TldD protein
VATTGLATLSLAATIRVGSTLEGVVMEISDSSRINAEFRDLARSGVADAVLSSATRGGATHAECRVEQVRDATLRIRDHHVEGGSDVTSRGLSVRVLVDGTWGFAATTSTHVDAARTATEQALAMARATRASTHERVELASEPVHVATWVSDYQLNPFDVAYDAKVALLTGWTNRLLAETGITHADASAHWVLENKFYADLSGTTTLQQRVRVHPQVTATSIDAESGAFETMRTLAPPVGRGWEYLEGTGWDWNDELGRLPGLLAEKLRAPSVVAGPIDLVIDPSNLWLTIHESIGHATELDRVLGYEAAFAGTSFAKFPLLGHLQYGSSCMNVTGDRVTEHGLATVGFDDEGVEAQSWDLIKDGVLVGYQLNRDMAERQGFGRSNGCAFADSSSHVPLQRMANVSLQPAMDGPSTTELISRVEDGVYVLGDKSWSIDMQRFNFQFTGQRFYRIHHGELAGQVKDVIYQGMTTDFWGAMEAVGGPNTYVLGGAMNCGKGQPDQVAPVSHGCPSALFRAVRVLNAAEEGRA